MKTFLPIMLVVAIGFSAQVNDEAQIRNDLASVLMKVQSSGRDVRQQTDALYQQLLTVPETNHQPNKWTIGTLTHQLTKGLAGRRLSPTIAGQMAEAMVDALRSAGVGTARFKDTIYRFEKLLSDVGVNGALAKAIASSLRTAGEEVRGPEDLPALPLIPK